MTAMIRRFMQTMSQFLGIQNSVRASDVRNINRQLVGKCRHCFTENLRKPSFFQFLDQPLDQVEWRIIHEYSVRSFDDLPELELISNLPRIFSVNSTSPSRHSRSIAKLLRTSKKL
jgi:hypothetical protein